MVPFFVKLPYESPQKNCKLGNEGILRNLHFGVVEHSISFVNTKIQTEQQDNLQTQYPASCYQWMGGAYKINLNNWLKQRQQVGIFSPLLFRLNLRNSHWSMVNLLPLTQKNVLPLTQILGYHLDP